jgi:hypothetical protein
MKFFRLSVGAVFLRLHLMMWIILIAGYNHAWWLAFLAFPVFLSCLIGLRVGPAYEALKRRYLDKTKYNHARVVAQSA